MIAEITSIGGSNIQYKKPNLDDLLHYRENVNLPTAQNFLKIRKNLTDETIKRFGLGYDYYRNNISIPEMKNGDIVNVAYRALEDDAKIKYGKEKGCENWIFHQQGLEEAKKKGSVLVLSNQFDVMSAVQAGMEAVVSVPVGKDGVGLWMELFDNVPKIYTCFENNSKSKKYALDFAERIGTDKSFEIQLPDSTKDLNEYFKSHDISEFKELVKNARPYYSYRYKGLNDVIDLIRIKKDDTYKFDCIPYVEFEEDWIAILSGVSNSGKTTAILNIANQLGKENTPVLILPFERGIKTVGKRFLQVRTNKNQYEIDSMSNSELDELSDDVKDLPIYFSMPTREQIRDTIARAKKIFNIKVVLVDHLDYLVRKSTENHNVETSNTLQEFKSLAQEFNVLFLIVHHIKKQEGISNIPKKPKMEDLKGSSSTYQDPEAVIMLSVPEKGQLEVDIVKNKGEMGSMIYNFNTQTGVIGKPITETPEIMTEEQKTQTSFDSF